jgi:hypothetical protein
MPGPFSQPLTGPESKIPAPNRPPQGRKQSRIVEVSDIALLAKAITDAVTEASPVKQVHISKYKAITPWNPTGALRRPAMNAKFLDNGSEIPDWKVTDEDIALLNQLKPGRYLDRKLEVIERNDNGGARTVEIRYSNKNVGQRMEMKNYGRNFTELLQNIVTEQKPKAGTAKA